METAYEQISEPLARSQTSAERNAAAQEAAPINEASANTAAERRSH